MFENPVVATVFISVIVVVIFSVGFAIIWPMRYVFRKGYFIAEFIGEDRRAGSTLIKADESDRDFEIQMFGKLFKYGIDKDRIYRFGRWRMPKSYYKIGDAVPRDLLDEGEDSEVAALDYAQVARNTVTRDLLSAFDTQFLSAQNIFMLTIGIVVAAVLILGVFVNQKFTELQDQISVPAPVTTSPPSSDDLAGSLN